MTTHPRSRNISFYLNPHGRCAPAILLWAGLIVMTWSVFIPTSLGNAESPITTRVLPLATLGAPVVARRVGCHPVPKLAGAP